MHASGRNTDFGKTSNIGTFIFGFMYLSLAKLIDRSLCRELLPVPFPRAGGGELAFGRGTGKGVPEKIRCC